jgi:hypothetical protein
VVSGYKEAGKQDKKEGGDGDGDKGTEGSGGGGGGGGSDKAGPVPTAKLVRLKIRYQPLVGAVTS